MSTSSPVMRATAGMLTGGAMPEYLFRRTDGVVGLLERLVEDGCRDAIESGQERLTEGLLDGVAISLDDASGRDRNAGEIPVVPPQTADPAHSKPKRGRNTVFDDHGPAAVSS